MRRREPSRLGAIWCASSTRSIPTAIGLNDVSDALRLHSGMPVTLRWATPPSRNNFSHANKERDAALAEKIFWAVLAHLQTLQAGFARGNRGKGVARRFKRVIHVVDSTTIQLVASCMGWAKYRRRKATAKCHLRPDRHTFLPRFATIDTARENDALRSRELCAGIRSGGDRPLRRHLEQLQVNRSRKRHGGSSCSNGFPRRN